jgi:flagellar basal body rod protein FlgF
MNLLNSIERLIELVEIDVGVNGACSDEPDDSSVALMGDGTESVMNFGHVRLARSDLEALKLIASKEQKDG